MRQYSNQSQNNWDGWWRRCVKMVISRILSPIIFDRLAWPGIGINFLIQHYFCGYPSWTELLQPGLFASDEENKAFYRLLLIQSWSKQIKWSDRSVSKRNCWFLSIGDGWASGIGWVIACPCLRCPLHLLLLRLQKKVLFLKRSSHIFAPIPSSFEGILASLTKGGLREQASASYFKKALFVHIRVATDLLQPGLFALNNTQNLAYCRL